MMKETSLSPSSPNKYSRPAAIFLGVLIAIYLLNICSPLRLHYDSLRYFAIMDCINIGCPPDSDAALDYLPWGYTSLLIALSRIGLLKSSVLILINIAYLFGGLFYLRKMFKDVGLAVYFLVFVLLNWTIIKFVIHPLSEMQYLFFSLLSLYLFYRFTVKRNLLFLFLSFVAAGLAFLTRTVGIAMVGALGLGLIWEYRKELLVFIKKYKIAVVGVIVAGICVVVFSKQLGLNHYTGVFSKQFDDGVSLPKVLGWHFTEWTEIFLNVSVTKVSQYISPGISLPVFIALGVIFLLGFIYIAFVRNRDVPFIIKAYLALYLLLMFNWPFYDPRFWVPVLPIMTILVVRFAMSLPVKSWLSITFKGAGVAYALLGLVSIVSLTVVSLDKEKVAKTHASGVYRNEYETVFFGKPLSDTAKKIDAAAVSVLQRYNK